MSQAKRLCLVLMLMAGGSGVARGEVEVVRRWDFNAAAEAEGWRIGNGLKDLAVADGRLRMTLTHADAFVFAPPVEAPLDGCAIRMRVRGDRDGNWQVYWTTSDKPAYGEQAAASRHVRAAVPGAPDEGLVVLEFPLGGPGDAGRKLTGFRIDPCNGPGAGTVEIDFVELIRLPAVLDACFAAANHHIDIGEPVNAQLRVRQIAGRAASGAVEVVMPDGRREQITVPPTDWAKRAGELRFDRPGVQQASVSVSTGADASFSLATSVIVGQGERLSLGPGLRSERVRLDLVPTPDGRQVGAARWMVRAGVGEGADWKLAGWLLPLAQVTTEATRGKTVRREPAMTVVEQSPQRVLLSGELSDDPSWRIELDVKLIEKGGHEAIDMAAKLAGPDGGRLLDFSGPVLRAEREPAGELLDRFAIFGGLEFLEPGWPSSSDRAVGKRFAERWSPHPFKVTLPLMAVEAGGLTSAMMWQPLDKWAGDDNMPTATFASPNFLDGQPNHLMKLSVPTVPRWRQENEAWARVAYEMKGGQPITLRCVLYAEGGLPAAMCARRWYELFGPPPPPPAPHDDKALYDLIARHYGETMYWPAEKGWRYHWYLGKESSFVPFMAAELLAHALQTGDGQWVRKTGLTQRTVIDTAGPLAARLAHDGGAKAQIAAMRPDGTWPFVNTEQMRKQARELTQGQYDSLGEDGSTSLGTCVQAALPILRYAELTGEAACVTAGLKALEAMKRFRVPRGAQVWEVHQEIPDIRAAALAVEACQIGYHLTRDGRFLDDANYWAWTGVPFAYAWHVPIERTAGSMVASRDRDNWDRVSVPLSEGFQNPNRQVAPYGTVPVLGPTFYVVNWFGVMVQWCGLEWAWKVIELDADRPDRLLRYVADGVVASGLQQVFDRPPWVGLYPDVWDTQGNTACGALICAMLPMECLRAQGRLPAGPTTWTRVLCEPAAGGHDPAAGPQEPAGGGQEPAAGRWHVSGWGRPEKLNPPTSTGPWSATVTFLKGQPSELLLAGVDQPARVSVGRERLERLETNVPADTIGWRYDADRRATLVRFRHAQERATIQVDW